MPPKSAIRNPQSAMWSDYWPYPVSPINDDLAFALVAGMMACFFLGVVLWPAWLLSAALAVLYVARVALWRLARHRRRVATEDTENTEKGNGRAKS